MDIRVQNTKNQLQKALIKCLENIPLRNLKAKDVIAISGISSRTFYQYYSGVNDLANEVENSFVMEFKRRIEKDRAALFKAGIKNPSKQQLGDRLNAYSHTLTFCFANQHLIKVLLSNNGDIRFYNLIYQAGYDEFMERIISNVPQSEFQLTEKERIQLDISIKIFVREMIDFIRVMLDYNDRLSPYEIREKVNEYLNQSPLTALSSLIPSQK